MVVKLDNEIWFPNPKDAEEDGLMAVGGDLSPERLELAYSYGIFPWFSFRKENYMFFNEDLLDDDGRVMPQWYCPKKRFVIFPDEVHVSHSMRQLLKKGEYDVTFNNAFDQVIGYCSSLRIDEQYAWLGQDMIDAYKKLHELGHAYSVEVWDKDGKLVGGLYGVWVNRIFCGESMFSLVPNGSKIALIYLAGIVKQAGGSIIDCQMETSHLKSMGGRYISYKEYMELS